MSDDTEYPEKVDVLKADRRGRVNLGSEYGEKTVRVAVLEVVED